MVCVACVCVCVCVCARAHASVRVHTRACDAMVWDSVFVGLGPLALPSRSTWSSQLAAPHAPAATRDPFTTTDADAACVALQQDLDTAQARFKEFELKDAKVGRCDTPGTSICLVM